MSDLRADMCIECTPDGRQAVAEARATMAERAVVVAAQRSVSIADIIADPQVSVASEPGHWDALLHELLRKGWVRVRPPAPVREPGPPPVQPSFLSSQEKDATPPAHATSRDAASDALSTVPPDPPPVESPASIDAIALNEEGGEALRHALMGIR